jgi:hypothetical protein
VAAKSIAAIPAESIPFIGVAMLIADTGYELFAACESIRDLDVLYSDFGMADETPDDAMHIVCDPELPEAGEVWGGVVEKSGQCLEQARGLCRSILEYPYSSFDYWPARITAGFSQELLIVSGGKRWRLYVFIRRF